MKERSLLIVFAITLANCLNYRAGVNALMDMERNGGNLKRGMLGFPSPDQLGVKVGVIRIGLFTGLPVGFRSN